MFNLSFYQYNLVILLLLWQHIIEEHIHKLID